MERRFKAVEHFKDVLMKPTYMSWNTLKICPRNCFDEIGPSTQNCAIWPILPSFKCFIAFKGSNVYILFAPGCKTTPGCKSAPGAILAFICNKI